MSFKTSVTQGVSRTCDSGPPQLISTVTTTKADDDIIIDGSTLGFMKHIQIPYLVGSPATLVMSFGSLM